MQTGPDFLIIGTQKGGTSSLFTYLGQHPRFQLPKKKEIHFFDYNFYRGFDWYAEFFNTARTHDACLTGEASPYYMYHPLCAQRVLNYNPRIKLILLLRNPAERAYSHFMMQRVKGIEPIASFQEALDAEPGRMAGEEEKICRMENYYSFNHQMFTYLSRGFYHRQMLPWFRLFPRNQFLCIQSEQFFLDPLSVLEKVYDFLEVDPHLVHDLAPVNANEYPPMEAATRHWLDEIYYPENKKLSDLTGQDFTW